MPVPYGSSPEINILDGQTPIALLPVKIITKINKVSTQSNELQLRIYPDLIHASSLERNVTKSETELFNSIYDNQELTDEEKWTRISHAISPERAAYLLHLKNSNQNVETVQTKKEKATAKLLPSRFVILCYNNNQLIKKFHTKKIPKDLSITPDLSQDEGVNKSLCAKDPKGRGQILKGPMINSSTAWLYDFKAAVSSGMGVSIPLIGEYKNGFDRIVVLGVNDPQINSKELKNLLEDHHYTHGLSFLPQGAITNHTENHSVFDYTNRSQYGAERMLVDRKPIDGKRTFDLLGLDFNDNSTDLCKRMYCCDLNQQELEKDIHELLWPSTIEYFLKEFFDAEYKDTAQLKDFFINHVKTGTHCANILIGETPYSILPTTSLKDWSENPSDKSWRKALQATIQFFHPFFEEAISKTTKVNSKKPTDEELLKILTLTPQSKEFWKRDVLNTEFLSSMGTFIGGRNTLLSGNRETKDLLEKFKLTSNSSIPYLIFSQSETLEIEDLLEPKSDINKLSDDLKQLLKSRLPYLIMEATKNIKDQKNPSLFYQLVQRSIILEARRLIETKAGLLKDKPVISILESSHGRGASHSLFKKVTRKKVIKKKKTSKLTTGKAIFDTDLLSNTKVLKKFRSTIFTKKSAVELSGLKDELIRISKASVQDLARYFSGTLDACAHRIDSWITALASERLQSKDDNRFIGAYGWIENVKISKKSNQYDGFIHAPSIQHAKTAAVINNGIQSHNINNFDFGSKSAREAVKILNLMKSGLKVNQILMDDLKRKLHDRKLDVYFPILVHKSSNDFYKILSQCSDASGKLSLDLNFVKAQLMKWQLHIKANVPMTQWNTQFSTIYKVIQTIDSNLRSLNSLILAESTHKWVQGDLSTSGDVADSLIKNNAIPNPDILSRPFEGKTIKNNFIWMDSPQQSCSNEWSEQGQSILTQLFPNLSSLVTKQLPDPSRVVFGTSINNEVKRHTLKETSLSALDFVFRYDRIIHFLTDLFKCPIVEVNHTSEEMGLLSFLSLCKITRSSILSSRALKISDFNVESVEYETTIDDTFKNQILSHFNSLHNLPADEKKIRLFQIGMDKASDEQITNKKGQLVNLIESSNEMNELDIVEFAFGHRIPRIKTIRVNDELKLVLKSLGKLGLQEQAEWINFYGDIRTPIRSWNQLHMGFTNTHKVKNKLFGTLYYSADDKLVTDSFNSKKYIQDDSHSSGAFQLACYIPPAFSVDSDEIYGFVLDSWDDCIPHKEQQSGLSFHTDSKGPEAPNTILVVVPPQLDTKKWTLETLARSVNETLDLAKIRTLRTENIDKLSHVLPAIYLPKDLTGKNISSPYDKNGAI